MGKKTWLDCPECGQDVFESDADGLFTETDVPVRCPDCKILLVIRADEGPYDDGRLIAYAHEVDDPDAPDVRAAEGKASDG